MAPDTDRRRRPTAPWRHPVVLWLGVLDAGITLINLAHHQAGWNDVTACGSWVALCLLMTWRYHRPPDPARRGPVRTWVSDHAFVITGGLMTTYLLTWATINLARTHYAELVVDLVFVPVVWGFLKLMDRW